MSRSGENWEQEKEEMRMRLELAESLVKKHEEQMAEMTAKMERYVFSAEAEHGGDAASSVNGGIRRDGGERTDRERLTREARNRDEARDTGVRRGRDFREGAELRGDSYGGRDDSRGKGEQKRIPASYGRREAFREEFREGDDGENEFRRVENRLDEREGEQNRTEFRRGTREDFGNRNEFRRRERAGIDNRPGEQNRVDFRGGARDEFDFQPEVHEENEHRGRNYFREGTHGGGEFRRETWRKLEIPIFSGDDAYGWTHRLERYFQLKELTEGEKMQATVMALEGKALSWYHWWEKCNPRPNWEGFKIAVVRRFQPSMIQNPFEQLLALKQTGSVEEFVEDFEKFVGALRSIDPEFTRGIFLNGLKEELRAEVKLYELQSLSDVIQKVLLIEQKNAILSRRGSFGYASRMGGNQRVNPYSRTITVESKSIGEGRQNSFVGSNTVAQSAPKLVNEGARPRGGEFKHLTSAEVRERREKGLCFRCDEPFTRDHRCKNRQFRMLILEEEEEDEEERGENSIETSEVHDLRLSLCSMSGFTTTRSWKVEGMLNRRKVVVLIDCGASHNFIAHEVVQELRLSVQNTPSYVVEVGDGRKVKCRGKCAHLSFQIQNLEVTQDFYLFSLKGVDLVLGLEWLSGLGEVQADFGKLELTIKQGQKSIRITGDPALAKTEVSYGALLQVIRAEGEGLIMRCESSDPRDGGIESTPIRMLPVLEDFEELFTDPTGLPPVRRQDHAIHLVEGATIPNIRPYKYPHYQKTEIEGLVMEMLASGVIQHSISPYSSPVILVKKKDGGWRFCVDYRALNRVTIPNKFPIPIIEELLDEIGGATVFTKLDLKSGYHQIRMRSEDVEKTAFRTHEGHYEFVVMPFGLTNAPSTFQALMNEVLRPYLRRFALVFFDDILVYSPDEESHERELREVLTALRTHALKINRKKCSFAKPSLEYLGHIISRSGVAADESKVATMSSWPIPRDVKSLRGFLGLTGYYRRFVQGYGRIAKPLTELLKKDNFAWTDETTQAFQTLKEAMVSLPRLAVPDFSKTFVLETDASSKGIGAVLMQEGRPLAFWSKGLSARSQQKSVYERELMALVQAVQKWKHYLLGRHFIIRTDQRSLKFLTEQRLFSEEQFKWAVKLIGLDFEIQFKPGRENTVADALSRKAYYSALSVINVGDAEGWFQEVQQEPKWRKVVQDLAENPESHPGFQFQSGRLLYKGSVVGGHSGFFRTYKQVSSFFYWDGMRGYMKQDQIFLSQFWQELFRRAGTRLKFSTAYHPQTDGQTEVVNRGLETYLRCFAGPKPRKWVEWLSWAEFWFNTTYNVSAGMTPFKALYGRDPPTLIKGCTFTSKVEGVNQLLVARDEVLQELRQNLLRAQDLMKAQADKHRREVEFEVGDWRIGPVAYRLALPEHTRVHPVFHVSLLKKALKPTQQSQPLPLILSEEWELKVQPATLLQHRVDQDGDIEVLVQWEGLPECENSWESAAQMQEAFPQFALEDKLSLLEGGIDRMRGRPPITQVYRRRPRGSHVAI
ncbi:PREDICTED: uncharacterized protein LOC109327750 [Lupinus angustifolius]|uniref:uncharacterized protein LOC109327750 n=1 Tax=Lupinus angustifolius TaxID=3871 RepID=UPI00092FBF0C|nr:PREDICTED: uncharacterized protein LOC109327750 [Lupinus angustifolius]